MFSTFGKMAKFRQVKAVIFDMDGLILDTETLYSLATQNILDETGVKKTYSWDVKQTLMGLQREEVSKKIVDIYEIPLTWEEYMDRQQAQIEVLMQNAQLLPDTEKVYQTVFADICQKYDKPFPLQTRLKVLGTTERKSCAITVEDCQLPCTTDEFLKDYKTLSLQRLGNCDILRGAERLIRHLHDNDVPIALATSSGEDSVLVKTKNHQDLFSLFHHKVMGSSDPEVKQGKPAPDIFLIASQRFKETVEPTDCLVFEDAPNGVTAARSAGMQCVMVPDDNVSQDLRKEATLVLRTLNDFKPEEFGLPPFKSS